ncbi:MAG: Ltp family lipoprotein [Gaiellaceae bacterium]
MAATPPAAAKKVWVQRHPIITVILALIILGAIGSALSNGKDSGSSGTSANEPPAAASTSTKSPTTTSAPPAPKMTAAQEQAIQSAQSYLSMDSGFSRTGLIDQLSSSAGSGFPKAVAVFAVNHLNVNWNEQAVLAAKGYLAMGTGFSREGLIDQLSSSAGSQFTRAQAVYAANHVGL